MLKEMFSGFSKSAKDATGRPAFETFGQVRIARALGEEILNATAERRNHLRGIRDFLMSMTLEEKFGLVDRVFARLALWAFDLPASESHHHSHPGGLVDHLLEVAYLAARELSGPGFRASIDTGVNRREQPLWAYAGVIGAVAHDIGKAFEMTVNVPGTSTFWDPRAEPLRHFCQRYELSSTGPALWHWKPRTLTSHEAYTQEGLDLVITPDVRDYLGPRLGSVLGALKSARELSWKPGSTGPAKEVEDTIRRADGTSTAKSVRERRVASREPQAPPREPASVSLPDRPGSTAPEETPTTVDRVTRAVVSVTAADPVLPQVEVPPPPPEDFYQERIPRRRGDPVENEARLRVQLDPARLLDTIRRFIVGMRLSRNGLYSAVYIRPDFTWLALPKAFFKVAQWVKLPFDKQIQDRMVEALGQSPLVVPAAPNRIPIYARSRPDCPVSELVRIRTVGFLSRSDLARLGTHAFEIVDMSEVDAFSNPGGIGEGS